MFVCGSDVGERMVVHGVPTIWCTSSPLLFGMDCTGRDTGNRSVRSSWLDAVVHFLRGTSADQHGQWRMGTDIQNLWFSLDVYRRNAMGWDWSLYAGVVWIFARNPSLALGTAHCMRGGYRHAGTISLSELPVLVPADV